MCALELKFAGSGITSEISERRNQFADERQSEVKYQTLSIALIATNRPVGLLRFGSSFVIQRGLPLEETLVVFGHPASTVRKTPPLFQILHYPLT